MRFEDFLNTINSIKKCDLPAMESHEKMAPLERIRLIKEAKNTFKEARKAAVMMLFYPKNKVTYLVLIVRNSYPGVHSSQIAFPGGKTELFDISYEATALRETFEEIGIHESQIEIIRSFTDIYIPPSNFIVYPFLGVANSELEFKIQEDEVASIIEMPLSSLLDDSILVVKNIDTSYAKSIDVPAFQIENHIVWGATAMMLSELKDTLKMVY
ncbi:MAG: CoA pyrophosphatase [Flavobacterium sp.]|nr:CoA pyrophosphatase [Flavobacterium sp.]